MWRSGSAPQWEAAPGCSRAASRVPAVPVPAAAPARRPWLEWGVPQLAGVSGRGWTPVTRSVCRGTCAAGRARPSAAAARPLTAGAEAMAGVQPAADARAAARASAGPKVRPQPAMSPGRPRAPRWSGGRSERGERAGPCRNPARLTRGFRGRAKPRVHPRRGGRHRRAHALPSAALRTERSSVRPRLPLPQRRFPRLRSAWQRFPWHEERRPPGRRLCPRSSRDRRGLRLRTSPPRTGPASMGSYRMPGPMALGPTMPERRSVDPRHRCSRSQ